MAHVTDSSEVANLSEFHMTIQTRVTALTQKQKTMLLTVSVVKALSIGIDITLYMAMEFLQNALKRSGSDPLYESNQHTRQALLLSELVLTSIKGSWFNLKERERVSQELVEQIVATNWLPNKRTLDSWSQHWDLEKYLSIRIVPVEDLISRQPTTAERYSGYTKGYGQDGNPPAPHKTKEEPSDGQLIPDPPTIPLLEFESYRAILSSIERERALKRKK
jgi:hypothetical protein